MLPRPPDSEAASPRPLPPASLGARKDAPLFCRAAPAAARAVRVDEEGGRRGVTRGAAAGGC
jgi:hypothetical protein